VAPFNFRTRQATFTLGEQTFDGLGRQLTVVVGGRTTHYEYLAEQLPPSANVLPDGKRVEFTYEPMLENQLRTIQPSNEAANSIAYDPRLGLPISVAGPLGTQTMKYTPSGLPESNTWTVDGKDNVTTWRHALGGLLLGFDDADEVKHERDYDSYGRLSKLTADGITRDITYDEFDRIGSFTDVDTTSGNRLLQTRTYDALGREHTRTFDITVKGSPERRIVQTLGYSALDQLTSRKWDYGTETGEETFAYDSRGRLIHYTANPTAAPTDPFGNRVIDQVFKLNALDGYVEISSTFIGGGVDVATFEYASLVDSTQVSSISHSHPSWPTRIDIAYDDCGRAINYRFPATAQRPALDRTLTWDAQDRLVKVDDQTTMCDYRYDPSGQLTDRVVDGRLTRSFFSGGQITHERTGDQTLRLIGDGNALFAQTKIAAGVRHATTLLGCDAQGSVRLEADNAVRTRRYSAHGAEAANDDNSPFGYAGERRDTFTGWYIPNGYRPYDPIIMGFLSPDSDSPFGQGGLNSYAYCAGDPVNRIDPTGHGWLTWLAAGIGIGLAVIGTIATFGAAAPAFAALATGGIGALTASGAMAVGVATMSAVSLGTGIASTVLEATDKDSKAASILGWVSLGTGLAEIGLTMAPKAASKLGLRLGRSIGRAAQKTAKGPIFSRPAPIGPSHYKKSSIVTQLYEAKPGHADVRLHPNYLNTGYPAFETHGMPFDINSNLWNSKGVFRPAEEVALEAESWLRTIDYPPGEPFILLACNGGSSGAAAKIAKVTKRAVISFKKTILVDTGDSSQLFRHTPRTTNHPLALRSFKKILTQPPPYSNHFFYEAAEMEIYTPT